MSEQPSDYKLDHAHNVTHQIRSIFAFAKESGKTAKCATLMKKAVHLLQTNPHGWGDPEYHSKSSDGVVCHAILRPVSFRYVVFEQAHAVVLLNVQLYAAFE
jgi:hypothetical protein